MARFNKRGSLIILLIQRGSPQESLTMIHPTGCRKRLATRQIRTSRCRLATSSKLVGMWARLILGDRNGRSPK